MDTLGHRLRADESGVHVTIAAAFKVREQQEKLVASTPGDKVCLSRRATQTVREHLQDGIALLVTQRVIHQAEVVQVNHHNCN